MSQQVEFRLNGSGDSLFFYLLIPTSILMSGVISCIWYFFNIKWNIFRWHYFGFFLIYLRYFLAFTMFKYGFAKVFYIQFPEISLVELTQELGHSSPMGLLWKFMGHSEAYSVFTGIVEVVSGFLLLFHRTLLFGATLFLIIMTQVFSLNLFYDVPVKLFSLHLILAGIIIVAPHVHIFSNLFLNRKGIFSFSINPYSPRAFTKLAYAFKLLLIITVMSSLISSAITSQGNYGKRLEANMLYGIYEVDFFIVNEDTLALSRKNHEVWDRLIIDKKTAVLEKMSRERINMDLKINLDSSSIELTPYLNNDEFYNLKFNKVGDSLVLKGRYKKDTMTVELFKKERTSYFLEKRGFNLLNEYPMNR